MKYGLIIVAGLLLWLVAWLMGKLGQIEFKRKGK